MVSSCCSVPAFLAARSAASSIATRFIGNWTLPLDWMIGRVYYPQSAEAWPWQASTAEQGLGLANRTVLSPPW